MSYTIRSKPSLDPASLRGVLLPDVGSDLGNNVVVRQRLCLRRRTRVPECGTNASVGGLLPPACDACDETRGELAELLALQQARTSQQVEHAELDYERSIHPFLDGVGVVIKEDQLGAATQFFECVAKTVSEAVGRGKQKFNRTRPYVLSRELHVLKEVRPDNLRLTLPGTQLMGWPLVFYLRAWYPICATNFTTLFKTTDLAV